MKEAGFHDKQVTQVSKRAGQTLSPSGTSPTIQRPLPRPLPRREGRDHRATPTVLLFVAYGVSCGCITRFPAQFVSLFYMP